MENSVYNPVPSIFKLAFRWLLSLIVLVLGLSFSSCEDDPAVCEMQNTGTFVIENSHPNGSLEVYFNKTPRGRKGDVSIQPGEQGSMELPAGRTRLVAVLVIAECVGGRCSVKSIGQNDSEEDLATCQTRNFSF